jgi:CRISPR type III-A-associated RAMP protein Csm4
METFHIVKLNFTSPLHIGKGLGEYYDSSEKMLHSDTISGAIASAYCHLYGDGQLKDFMEAYRISSAFPFAGNSFFLPKPQVKLSIEFAAGESYSNNKRLKKIEYIDYRLFSKLAKGEKVVIQENQLSGNNKFLFAGQSQPVPYKDETMQRVVVPRLGGDATPFYFERRFFNAGCGLYFIYQVGGEFSEKFRSAIQWLGQSGFGTDKNVGNGQFQPEFADIQFEPVQNPDRVMVLSLFCPRKEEIIGVNFSHSTYALVQRGGFIAGTTNDGFRHLRKKSLYMFAEGSLFKTAVLQGKIENVRPEWNDPNLHPVYRDGRPIYIPVKI